MDEAECHIATMLVNVVTWGPPGNLGGGPAGRPRGTGTVSQENIRKRTDRRAETRMHTTHHRLAVYYYANTTQLLHTPSPSTTTTTRRNSPATQ